MKAFIFCISLFIASLTFSSVQDSVGVETKDGKEYINYIVSPGETIYRISTTYNVSISKLMEINPELQQGLRAGQRLLIPSTSTKRVVKDLTVSAPKEIKKVEVENTSQASNREEIVHTVKPGETLYGLSKKFGISVGDLLKWNGLELQEGQELVVGYSKEQNFSQLDDPVEATEPEAMTVTYNTVETVTGEDYTVYEYDSTRKQVLIVPFDPYLYFSDADAEISKGSNIPQIKVRDVFRRRLNALLAPKGYETIYLLGGHSADTLSDLNKIYSSVTYNYQDILYSDQYLKKQAIENPTETKKKNNVSSWVNKQKEKITATETTNSHTREDKFEGKFFGVKVSNPQLYPYLQQKYSVDYVIFINQFEVDTDYEHCLDRSVGNFDRFFIAHYSILDKQGRLIAGNKFKLVYSSNSNDVSTIVADNMLKIADRILLDLPPAY